MEPLKAIRNRQDAAKEWAEAFAEVTRQTPVTGKNRKALAVICLTDGTRNYLAEHDPMALKQCQEALNGKSYVEYL